MTGSMRARQKSSSISFLPKNGRHHLSMNLSTSDIDLIGGVWVSVAQDRSQTFTTWGSLGSFAAVAGDDPISRGLRESARRMVGIALFSGVINLLMLSGSLYMLQVYD